MKAELVGKTFGVEVLQPKCLNLPVEDVRCRSDRRAVARSDAYRGKWLLVRDRPGLAAAQPGHGRGDPAASRADRCRRNVAWSSTLHDGTCLAVNFWWFGYAHYVPAGELAEHAMTAKLGPNAST